MHALAFVGREFEIIVIAGFVQSPVENAGELRRRRFGRTVVWFLFERLTFRIGFDLEPTGARVIGRRHAERNETRRVACVGQGDIQLRQRDRFRAPPIRTT